METRKLHKSASEPKHREEMESEQIADTLYLF